MRGVQNIREMGLLEKEIAKSVFKNTVPYDQVWVSDGLGKDDREFTMPTSMPATYKFNVSQDKKYVMHVGDGFYGMSYAKGDKRTLIHELTHVWQGEHSGSSWDYVFSSAWSQTLLDNAYAYDHQRLNPWDDYNPEQQAKIVEEWYADGMKEKEEEDRRFYFIKKHIRGENMDYDWIAAQWVVKPLDVGTLNVKVAYPSLDSYLEPILEKRFHADDKSGYGGRVAKLEEIFRRLEREDARQLFDRLEARRRGDKVAQYFHDHLSLPSRTKLLGLLKGT
jgi:hypothetical protein